MPPPRPNPNNKLLLDHTRACSSSLTGCTAVLHGLTCFPAIPVLYYPTPPRQANKFLSNPDNVPTMESETGRCTADACLMGCDCW